MSDSPAPRHAAEGPSAAPTGAVPGIRAGSAATLEASGIDVCYGDVSAVRKVSISVRGGDLVAVTGPSGAGKTSLLCALSGVVHPTEGAAWIDGVELGNRDEAVARGIVLVPQGNALVRIFTAVENVAVPLVSRRSKNRDAKDRAHAALELVGLEDAGDQLLEELSGGQQQRVAVARGLAERGRFLLADEPTSELDASNRERVMGLLRAEADRGVGVLVATHDPEAAAVCDAELRLDEGVAVWVRDDR
ncbi:MAG: ABC transporter ATP-binding protein [Jatrophihabitans sp.]